MLYVFEIDGKVRVGWLDPDDANNDFEKVLSESFVATLEDATRMPVETQARIVRNVLSAGLTVDRIVMR